MLKNPGGGAGTSTTSRVRQRSCGRLGDRIRPRLHGSGRPATRLDRSGGLVPWRWSKEGRGRCGRKEARWGGAAAPGRRWWPPAAPDRRRRRTWDAGSGGGSCVRLWRREHGTRERARDEMNEGSEWLRGRDGIEGDGDRDAVPFRREGTMGTREEEDRAREREGDGGARGRYRGRRESGSLGLGLRH